MEGMMKITDEMIKAALSAKMPDGLSVVDHLEDALPSREDLEALGCPTTGYYHSDIRADMHEWFYEVLIGHILTAALSASPAGVVKPLEWRKLYEDSKAWPMTWHGKGIFDKIYPIEQYYRNHQFYTLGKGFDTLEAAKSAAFADYSARIMSAIEPAGVGGAIAERDARIAEQKAYIGQVNETMRVWAERATEAEARADALEAMLKETRKVAVDDVAYARVRVDTEPDQDGWCFCTPFNHPSDIERGQVDSEENGSAQFYGQVFASPASLKGDEQ